MRVEKPLPERNEATVVAAPLVLVPLATSTLMVDGAIVMGAVVVVELVVFDDDGGTVGIVPVPVETGSVAELAAAEPVPSPGRVADGSRSAPITTATATRSQPRTAPERSWGPKKSCASSLCPAGPVSVIGPVAPAP